MRRKAKKRGSEKDRGWGNPYSLDLLNPLENHLLKKKKI